MPCFHENHTGSQLSSPTKPMRRCAGFACSMQKLHLAHIRSILLPLLPTGIIMRDFEKSNVQY